MEFYKMNIAGIDCKLPICQLNDDLSIAGFVIFGNAPLTVACAEELLKIVPEFDYIVCPEAKSIPLAHEMSRQSGKKYFVLRKKAKAYMTEPVCIGVDSITTQGHQELYIDALEGRQLTGKRVLLVDDVISTGGSIESSEKLINKFDANIVGKAAILAEGDAAKRDDIIFLEKLPVFPRE